MERDRSIDIAKGIGILMVVLGHVPTIPIEFKKIIYSFHMPLFFFISGYLYNEKKYNQITIIKFATIKMKKYIVPYFTIGIICFILFGVFYPLLNFGFSLKYLKIVFKYLFGLIYSRGFPDWMAWSCPLWFLTCIFLSEIILFLLLKFIKNPVFILTLITILGYYLSLVYSIKLPWNIDVSLIAVGFMYIGHICKKFKIIENIYNAEYEIILFFTLVLSIVFNSKIDFNLREYGNILITYAGGVSGSILTLTMARKIKKNTILEFFGINSLLMMGFTYSILNISMLINNHFKFIYNFIIDYIVQLVLLYLLVYIIINIKSINHKFKINI